ncbi:hypothetical protein Tco_0365025 [Tanacetum coccineum]
MGRPNIRLCCTYLIMEIIATVPLEIQEEVLLTSSDAVLSNLTPALVAEANMLRERFARRYNRTLFGMLPRSRRGESSRRGEGIGSSLDTRTSSKPIDTEGAPLVLVLVLVKIRACK